jgi:alkylation response protein AidB-like acyl-CoA dehydrogenase
MANDPVTLTLTLTEAEAEALAQMVKRFCWEDAERFGNRFDGGRERDGIWAAIGHLQRALREAGFAPR